MLNDVRIGVRMLLKDRGFTVAAVFTLALGIAATNTVFTLVNGVLIRDLPFDEPDRIVEPALSVRQPAGLARGESHVRGARRCR